MPARDSSSLLVARFLKSNNYLETYNVFVSEAGLEPDAGSVQPGDLTVEKLLDEKKAFDLSQNFEKLGTDVGRHSGWTQPGSGIAAFIVLPCIDDQIAPESAKEVLGLPARANILSLTAVSAGFATESLPSSNILVTTADRRLDTVAIATARHVSSLNALHDAPILSCTILQSNVIVTSSMSGQVILSDLDGKVFDRRRDHSKYVVKVIAVRTDATIVIATAGWDNTVNLYNVATSDIESSTAQLGVPIASISLPSKPETLLFVQHPDSERPVLVVTRTDSSFLYYYTAESDARLLGKQNLAPHSNAWVAFTPAAIALSPSDPTVLAVALSTLPSMKVIIVRMLLPALDVPATDLTPLQDESEMPETQTSRARREAAVADREHSAILIHCNTMAPQTAYSTPAIVWRPDGSGVWVNGDDGAIRGIEASTGRVVATLHGHESGSKVRCLWAGKTNGVGEVLVSGGFDQKLLVWQIEETLKAATATQA